MVTRDTGALTKTWRTRAGGGSGAPGICSKRRTWILHFCRQGPWAGTKTPVREFTLASHTRRARKGERYPQFSTSDRQEAARFQSMSEARNDILDFRNNPVNRSAREGK